MAKRREFLRFLGAGAGSLALSPLARVAFAIEPGPGVAKALPFTAIKGPMPVETDGLADAERPGHYARYSVVDDLTLPDGFEYDVIARWGDRLGDSRFGYNNDYLSFVERAKDVGYLTINFEYISPIPWLQSYQQVIGKSLPFAEVREAIKANDNRAINAFALPDDDPLKAKIRAVCEEALLDQGLGVMSIRRAAGGKWTRANGREDRRITGISGLRDGRYLKCTGPARAVFRLAKGQGYLDKLGERIIGSFGNCAGGTTPWGTALSAEENIQFQVPEQVYSDGTSFDPRELAFMMSGTTLNGQGNVFGLAGNKYGWIVEVDPSDPADFGTKHTWLGRFRHEAVGVRAVRGKPLAFYSGCDRTGGHVYKFVSRDRVQNPAAKSNSRLLSDGMLYAAKFSPGGKGRWIALAASTPVDPDMPSNVTGNMITLPLRPEGGSFKARTDEDAKAFKRRFKTLGDLYTGNAEQRQGAILIDAHYAANAAGATCTARPEDTEIAPDGSLYISFTTGSSSPLDGGSDKRVFKGPGGVTPHAHGFVMRLTEDGNDPGAMSFRWEMLAMGGEPAEGGAGFANPDNLLIDAAGDVWVVTDISTEKHNKAVPSRAGAEGKPLSQAELSGLFGNNSVWYIPTSGPGAGDAHLFAIGPMDCELTGPVFTRDEQTMFLAVQHPGERHGSRRDGASESRQFVIRTAKGAEFTQTREVPIGSNWPGGRANDPPIPAVVAIRRRDRGRISRVG